MRNPELLTLDPLDTAEARRAAHALAQRRRAVELQYQQALTDSAEAQHARKKKWATEFLNAEGSVDARKAEADKACEHLILDELQKDALAKGLKAALDGLEGERSMLKSFIDWSSRVDYQTGG